MIKKNKSETFMSLAFFNYPTLSGADILPSDL